MTRKEAIRQTHQSDMLQSLGFTRDEAEQLRRISMTLRRWYEQECGDSNSYSSWAIERDETTDRPYLVRHIYSPHRTEAQQRAGLPDRISRTLIADREKDAIKHLQGILQAVNILRVSAEWDIRLPVGSLSYYLQTDPRGASLYILRPGDVPDGKDVSAYYSRGICVY